MRNASSAPACQFQLHRAQGKSKGKSYWLQRGNPVGGTYRLLFFYKTADYIQRVNDPNVTDFFCVSQDGKRKFLLLFIQRECNRHYSVLSTLMPLYLH